jgi:hypothetical protein
VKTAGRSCFVACRAFCGLLLLLALASCSFTYEYVVVNESASPVEVRYSGAGCCSTQPSGLGRKAVGKLGDDDEPWKAVRADEISYEPQTKTVRVVLQPGEALLLTTLRYTASDVENYKTFPFDSLRITGAGGGVSYEGNQVLAQFEELHSKVYGVTYRSRDGK